jgi:hypothetical protein
MPSSVATASLTVLTDENAGPNVAVTSVENSAKAVC